MSVYAPELPVFVEIAGPERAVGMVVPEAVLIEITTVQPPRVARVHPVDFLEVVEPFVRGPTGPAGPAGLVKIHHGSDENYPRPDGVPLVYWVGSVPPLNADPDDLLMLKEA